MYECAVPTARMFTINNHTCECLNGLDLQHFQSFRHVAALTCSRSGPKPVPDDLIHHSDEALWRLILRQLQELCDSCVRDLGLGGRILGYICLRSIVELRVWQRPLHSPYGKRAHVAQGPVLVVIVPSFRSLEWVSEEFKLSDLIDDIIEDTLDNSISS